MAGNSLALHVQKLRPCLDFVEDRRHASGAVHIIHMPLPGWADLTQVGNPVSYGVDPLQRIFETRFVGDRQAVQHGIGRAAHGHIQGKSIVQRFGGHNRARGDIARYQVEDTHASLPGQFRAFGRVGQG